MTGKLQASEAMAIVRKCEDSVAAEYVRGALDTVRQASEQALTWVTGDVHPNPEVHEKVAKELERLGYRVHLLNDNTLRVSWSK